MVAQVHSISTSAFRRTGNFRSWRNPVPTGRPLHAPQLISLFFGGAGGSAATCTPSSTSPFTSAGVASP